MNNQMSEVQNHDNEEKLHEDQIPQPELMQDESIIAPEANDVEMNNKLNEIQNQDDDIEIHENQESQMEIVQESTITPPETNDSDMNTSPNLIESEVDQENNPPQTSTVPIINVTEGPKAKKLPVRHDGTAKKPVIRQFLKRNIPACETYTSTIEEVLDTEDQQNFEEKEYETQHEFET